MKTLHWIVAVAGIAVCASTAGAQEFKVVVNSGNPATSMSRDELAKIFLKQQTTWRSGQPTVVIDQGAASVARQAFSRRVLGKEVASVKSFWQQQIFSGRASPPPEKSSDADVLAAVAGNPGAVGYISATTAPAPGTKVLTVGS